MGFGIKSLHSVCLHLASVPAAPAAAVGVLQNFRPYHETNGDAFKFMNDDVRAREQRPVCTESGAAPTLLGIGIRLLLNKVCCIVYHCTVAKKGKVVAVYMHTINWKKC